MDASHGLRKVTFKKRKVTQNENSDSDVEILKVEPSVNVRQVEIIKVEQQKKKSPEVEILEVIPGTSACCSGYRPPHNDGKKVEGFVGRIQQSKILFLWYLK